MMAFRSPSDTGFECEFCLHENDPLFPCKQCIKSGGKKLLFTEKIPMPPVKPPKEEFKKCVHYNAADKENPVLTFAEKLKEYAFECDVSFGFGKEHYTKAVAVVDIDRLVEEMTEG